MSRDNKTDPNFLRQVCDFSKAKSLQTARRTMFHLHKRIHYVQKQILCEIVIMLCDIT